VLGKNCGEVKGKSESALFRHLGEEFSDLKNKSIIFLREHLKCIIITEYFLRGVMTIESRKAYMRKGTIDGLTVGYLV
jgi:hypothetical protein